MGEALSRMTMHIPIQVQLFAMLVRCRMSRPSLEVEAAGQPREVSLLRDMHTVCSSYWSFGGVGPTRFVLVIPRVGCATPMLVAGEPQGRTGLCAYRVSHILRTLAVHNISSTNGGVMPSESSSPWMKTQTSGACDKKLSVVPSVRLGS
jgi:hypothetical protein